ncbi:uncharacterized protein BX663DRAFT_552850 [Cokeromyces recurvatus]|uniref:uncharacterized protein n=1 Tax=Cokeromyces recurvatus TaxID=90255 RepID=UPI00222030BD|nr:uncharacterized protein BX663DRAFT_552850 [Cokeromyces recurvatus]KAI7901952.1 hypothetical protein BX663DRAFT_552850 [Cokeromyces recurvatus]
MKFTNVFKSNPIQTFELAITPSNDVAFGPGSIINGSVKLILGKPIKAKSIRVLFKCEEWELNKNQQNILFSIESTIWEQEEEENVFLDMGSHMYLFAIQLPSSVNYPPTIKDTHLGHRIEYSLQGYLDTSSSLSTKLTPVIPLTYLPLVTVSDDYLYKNEKTIKMDNVEMTASLVNPSSCPGDLCSIKLNTHNQTSCSINQIQLLLVSTTTSFHSKTREKDYPDLPTSGPSYRHKQRQLLCESFYVTIPKQSRNNVTICPIQIPSYCVPTTQSSQFGEYMDISYEIFILVPALIGNHHHSLSQLLLNPLVIRLPLFISTIPHTTTLTRVHIPFADHHQSTHTKLPNFIISEGSPNLLSSSVGSDCNWGPGSPIDVVDDEFILSQPQEDASGHLTVPTLYHRRLSS